MRHFLLLLMLALTTPALATEVMPRDPDPVGSGEVRVPLSVYTAMLNQLDQEPRRAPAAYAIGRSQVTVRVSDSDGRFAAAVELAVQIETFEDEWTLVPILPPGAALRHASVDGRPVQLVEGPDGLAWISEKAGAFTLRLGYGVDAQRFESGFLLPLVAPRAAATALELTFPGTGVDLAVVPSADLQSVEVDGMTRVTASVPATSRIMVTWRAAGPRPYVVSRARYEGALRNEALIWTARYQVEVFAGGPVTLSVMPSDVTLNDLRVDGAAATVIQEEGHFATVVRGRGLHEVLVEFQVPLEIADGPPRARLSIPRIPVSRFDLVLPGRKEVKVAPGADVVTAEEGDTTRATVFIPMSDSVVFTWTEAVPEALRAQVRANASLYHAVNAEEGVLHAQGSVVYEITHGETSLLELEIPADAQVNRIGSPNGGVSDWAVEDSGVEGRKTIKVFLERPISGEFLLEVSYERLLGAVADDDESFAVPLLSARRVHRQRGMVALLSGPDLALEPVTEEGLSKVGENQLPPFIRNQIAMTVAHTYKYTEATPNLRVAAVAPERKRGIFDARVDTLISLGDVTLKGSATVEIDVKSGTILDLRLLAPAEINVLGVSGPSLRTHQVEEGDEGQTIEIEFTREMDGQFRVEVNYERIMDAAASETAVPTISVAEAEVEHGRIAIEALTAVEVGATRVERLSSLDINELPQQLVLKTTNPILLAYRYVNAKPPFRLALKITRHKEIDVQVAAIEDAEYKSLVTRDGLSVTTARLIVRNSRRQFLRLDLPPESEVWSVFVDGKPEKPAYPSDGDGKGNSGDGSAVLVKMINSAEGFPVDIVYATPIESMDGLGSVSGRLPRPDMVVTRSRWDVFLPVGPRYYRPDSSMDVILNGVWANPRRLAEEAVERASDAYQNRMGQPLRISVPTRGIRFAFEKLYANQSPEEAGFEIRYVSAEANLFGEIASALGAVMIWIAIAALAGLRVRLPRAAIAALVASGVALLIVTIGYFGTSPLLASVLSLAIAGVLAAWSALHHWRAWRAAKAAS